MALPGMGEVLVLGPAPAVEGEGIASSVDVRGRFAFFLGIAVLAFMVPIVRRFEERWVQSESGMGSGREGSSGMIGRPGPKVLRQPTAPLARSLARSLLPGREREMVAG